MVSDSCKNSNKTFLPVLLVIYCSWNSLSNHYSWKSWNLRSSNWTRTPVAGYIDAGIRHLEDSYVIGGFNDLASHIAGDVRSSCRVNVYLFSVDIYS